jgi:hypothetical protein
MMAKIFLHFQMHAYITELNAHVLWLPNTTTTKFISPNCRICNTSKEENSHLYLPTVHTGLAQLRMKIYGTPVLNENFKWTPTQLLAMIKEIDKFCPEEGMVTDTNNTQTQNAGGEQIHE